MSVDTTAQISVAAADAGITPIVRVPGFQHFHATRVLEQVHKGSYSRTLKAEIAEKGLGLFLPLSSNWAPLGGFGAIHKLILKPFPMAEMGNRSTKTPFCCGNDRIPEGVQKVNEIAKVKGWMSS
ncbi:MAG: hypothetical protein CM1200mP4_4230 [Rhodospirillaceae bacterium]|nr:MAG: hypothetical protein CM1200mP4_4230 [Rhodospirillaceae bacterium]